ncbi:MAG: VWA domain-containing protein [Paludibacteraceae bacterium]|nr:VWA domain-containing protein [Paludibacteraceae bacterium]
MFRFANPEYLYALILIPIFIFLFFMMQYIRKRNIRKIGEGEAMKGMLLDYSATRVYVKFFLLQLGLAMLICCMARPQFGKRLETVKQRGLNIMVALDVSNSMLAEDIRPNRLGKAKQMLTRLVDGLQNDRIGLVVFAGDAYIQLPITADFVSAKMFFSSISTNMVATQGTSIGSAIELCMRSFPEKEGVGKAIIVITDGENHEDDAVQAAALAKEKGINVYVIGMGKPEGAPIPTGNGDFKHDRSGNTVISKLNEEMCGEIAKAGNGTYVRADNTNFAFNHIAKELENISTAEAETKVYSEYNEQFQGLAWLTLILLLLEFFILERESKWFKNKHFFD